MEAGGEEMMRPIKEGDIVDIFWGTGERLREVKVLNIPSDVGDLWYFEEKDGTIWAQNPVSFNFDCIRKTK